MMVKELLMVELIRPFHNLFASLVLLVKKKDGEWHFCDDYKALNKIIVPNRYPILIVEELLDKFYGSIFSMLDLHLGYYKI